MSVKEIKAFRVVCDSCGQPAADGETQTEAIRNARQDGYGHIFRNQIMQHRHYCWRTSCRESVEANL